MVKLTMYLVSLAPRANNYLIQIITQNNFAHVEMCIEGTCNVRTHTWPLLMDKSGARYFLPRASD